MGKGYAWDQDGNILSPQPPPPRIPPTDDTPDEETPEEEPTDA